MKLTRYERRSLMSGVNLSDGHARQDVAPYADVITRLPEIFQEAQQGSLEAIEADFEQAFFGHAGQAAYARLRPPLYNYACSLAIEVVAHFLVVNEMSVSLIHPTFDNLADILKGNGVCPQRIEQEQLCRDFDAGRDVATDALFIVCPNNPTGQVLTREEFTEIVESCAAHGKLLIVDFSFRFFSDFDAWDQYEILIGAGGSFITLEDSGKTWPTLDLKVGITLTSPSIYDQVLGLHEDLVLNASPFTLRLLEACIVADDGLPGRRSAPRVVAENRAILRDLLADTPLTIPNVESTISVEWVRIDPAWRTPDLCGWLASNDVHVLPGMPFFWDEPSRGESYIRVALARSTSEFAYAAGELARLVNEFGSARVPTAGSAVRTGA